VDEKGICSIDWEGANKPLSIRLDLRVRKVLERKVSVESLGFGKVELFRGKAARLLVEAVTLDGKLSLRRAGEAAMITVNGREVTAHKSRR
jgi:hypothetical protein